MLQLMAKKELKSKSRHSQQSK